MKTEFENKSIGELIHLAVETEGIIKKVLETVVSKLHSIKSSEEQAFIEIDQSATTTSLNALKKLLEGNILEYEKIKDRFEGLANGKFDDDDSESNLPEI